MYYQDTSSACTQDKIVILDTQPFDTQNTQPTSSHRMKHSNHLNVYVYGKFTKKFEKNKQNIHNFIQNTFSQGPWDTITQNIKDLNTHVIHAPKYSHHSQDPKDQQKDPNETQYDEFHITFKQLYEWMRSEETLPKSHVYSAKMNTLLFLKYHSIFPESAFSFKDKKLDTLPSSCEKFTFPEFISKNSFFYFETFQVHSHGSTHGSTQKTSFLPTFSYVKHKLHEALHEASIHCPFKFMSQIKKRSFSPIFIPSVFYQDETQKEVINHMTHPRTLSPYLCSFIPENYRILNFDLYPMTQQDLYAHFIQHGWKKEKRLYNFPDTQSILSKFSIPPDISFYKNVFILNHSNGLTGAPWVAYSMYATLLQNPDYKTFLCTPQFNKDMMSKISTTWKEDTFHTNVIEYFHNPYVLEKILKIINPAVIIVNSFNSSFCRIVQCLNTLQKEGTTVIYYTHEDPKYYIPYQMKLPIHPSAMWCADHKMLHYSPMHFPSSVPCILLPPKFSQETFQLIKHPPSTPTPFSTLKKRKLSKQIVVGMVGQPNERKNISGFIHFQRQTR